MTVPPLRILMLDNEFPPLGGGTGVVNYHILKELAAYPNIWVDLVTSSRTRRNYETERESERITIFKVPVNNRNIHHSSNRELLTYTWRGFWFSRDLVRERTYDLSFAFAGVPAGAISYALKRLTGLPYIVSLQGPDVPGFEARYSYLYPFLKPALRAIWGSADTVLAISRDHQQLAHETMPKLDIPIIYNGVDSATFCPGPARDGPLTVLCVGRLIERKGQHVLLKAMAKILHQQPDLTVVVHLVGTGDEEANLKRLATELDITRQVRFAGFVARERMPEIYRQADIFVLPSQNEGMSIALLEAMASGLPVIVTDVGGSYELVQPGENGLIVRWGDETALAESLATLLMDAALRQRMGRTSREKGERFAWPEITRQYVQLFRQVSEQAAGGE